MRRKQFLAAILLGVFFCFVSGVGYGEIKVNVIELKVPHIDFYLLEARVEYIMRNPTNFLYVKFRYDRNGSYGIGFPERLDTKGRIYVEIRDNRGFFSGRSGIVLLELFKMHLDNIYGYIQPLPTIGTEYDLLEYMEHDIVAKFYSKGDIPLGYYYKGEYHLWEE